MLPDEWEGINGLNEKSEDEIREEALRQLTSATDPFRHDPTPGAYTPRMFEETFNQDIVGLFNNETYWIKIF